MSAWGWRLPFIFGGVLAIVGYFVRRNISETPMFLKHGANKKNVIVELGSKYYLQVLNGIGLVIFPACFITFLLILPVYLNEIYHYKQSDIFLAMTIGYLWSTFLLPIFGWISDRINRKLLLIIACIIMAACSFSIFGILTSTSRVSIFVFTGICQTLIAIMAASYFVLLPQAFPTSVRFTGTALSYNITYSIAALIPLVVNYFYNNLQQPCYVPLLFAVLAVITALSTVTLKNHMEQEESDEKVVN
jgi:nitrate/nitrite transporter NarK